MSEVPRKVFQAPKKYNLDRDAARFGWKTIQQYLDENSDNTNLRALRARKCGLKRGRKECHKKPHAVLTVHDGCKLTFLCKSCLKHVIDNEIIGEQFDRWMEEIETVVA